MGQRGFFFGDLILIIVVLIVSALLLFVSYLVLNNTATSFASLNNTSVNQSFQNSLGAMKFMDALMVMLYGGMNVVAMILAWNINTHPILLGFLIILSPGLILATGFVSNTFYAITCGNLIPGAVCSSPFASIANNAFPMVSTIMVNLPLFTGIMLAVISIITFTRLQR